MRTPLLPFVVLVAIGKTARYAVLVAATLGWLA
jgi:membrane protein YqaA with SNARE-associated domain